MVVLMVLALGGLVTVWMVNSAAFAVWMSAHPHVDNAHWSQRAVSRLLVAVVCLAAELVGVVWSIAWGTKRRY